MGGRVYHGAGLAAAVLALMSSATLAQAVQSTDAKKSTAAVSNVQSNSINPAHQDQFGRASNVAAHVSTEQPGSPAEAKKHLAGVKYEDRAVAPNGTKAGQLDAKGTQEKHTNSTPAGAVNPRQ